MSKSQKELELMVENQKKQLTRYETRLKDVVSAYKSLLKEKAALEASLASITSKKIDSSDDPNESTMATLTDALNSSNDNVDQLRMQISTLMNSLATLSAEKSKMEASFQADKKTLRNDLKVKDQTISELQEKLNGSAAQIKLEVEKVKSKLIIERHEWEKESNNQLAMIRELQKITADERQVKDAIQMQLNDLKNRFSKTSEDARLSEITAELEQTKRKLKENERELNNATKNDIPSEGILKKLQAEMMYLKQQHTAAIQSEQHRAILAEERNKTLAAMHEERVASLETRLAELSATVGLYDRLRQTDQDNITKFKERIAQLSNSNVIEDRLNERKDSTATMSKYKNWDINEMINEILLLHNVLLIENSKLEKPVDIFTKLYSTFDTAAGKSSSNALCNCEHSERHETLLKENTNLHTEIQQMKKQIETHKTNIKTLQTKIEVLNRNLDEQETELRNKSQEHKNELRTERNRWKDVLANTEAEYRAKQAELEGQLQKQRERSLALLEEKENEITGLKTSFDVFMMPKPMRKRSEATDSEKDEKPRNSEKTLASLSDSLHGSNDDVNQTVLVLSGNVSTSKEPIPMLHYVHELSRKEVEITSLRKAKHLAEQTLRQALQDKAASQQLFYEKIANLEENVDRLERCKTREGANLEYLKNVFLSFLLSNDKDGQRHKVNAISAVLQFSPSEISAVNKHFNTNEKK
ncbi:GRIP and coiled-coil domain-containing protein 1 [Contarinia nasturtii]|uniref:GRIP and coiled-coil domain-containing protein 1 n=1 Tax=Contarinia nasturtii TaxID=265458 RepID=UPI0012D436FC|nr:GRIP and coiled-coil domain-containing protein 1 [Contarinia nasturtii]